MLHNDSEPLEASGYVLGDFTPRLFLPGVAGDGAGLGGYLHVCRGQVRYGWEKKGWLSKKGTTIPMLHGGRANGKGRYK